jgi:hypothetical protein
LREPVAVVDLLLPITTGGDHPPISYKPSATGGDFFLATGGDFLLAMGTCDVLTKDDAARATHCEVSWPDNVPAKSLGKSTMSQFTK